MSGELNFVETVNRHTNKKKIEGLTVGEYFLLNIIEMLPIRSTTLTSPAGDLKTPHGIGVHPSTNCRRSFPSFWLSSDPESGAFASRMLM